MAAQSLHAQVTHTVQENGFAYSPATLTITAGRKCKIRGHRKSSHPGSQWNRMVQQYDITLEGGFAFSDGSGTVAFRNQEPTIMSAPPRCFAGMKVKLLFLHRRPWMKLRQPMNTMFIRCLWRQWVVVKSHSAPLQHVSVEIYTWPEILGSHPRRYKVISTCVLIAAHFPKGCFSEIEVRWGDYVSKV